MGWAARRNPLNADARRQAKQVADRLLDDPTRPTPAFWHNHRVRIRNDYARALALDIMQRAADRVYQSLQP